ncbi:MAG TPA: penicillin-binding protein 2 [Rhodobacterales bacterium]|nr:penicillin-binding protein 2 [Rhodobacterales bacterium]
MSVRIPLRPLARILDARRQGENPDRIESENLRKRHEEMRDRARLRAEGRLLVLAALFLCAFIVVGFRMGELSASEPQEPSGHGQRVAITQARADIVDRNGRILATNMLTRALYAQPPMMVDKPQAARALARIFPDLDEAKLLEQFTGTRKFIWIKRKISPEQQQLVHDIGEPGLLFGPREMRLYPNGAIAAHVLGGAGFGREGVNAAEVIGVAGVEKYFDEALRDPANAGTPLALSLDLTVQAAVEEVLDGGMKIMGAKGAAGVLMDVYTGEVISLVSLPDFDPNNRPRPLTEGDAADSPLFNRAVQGLYELGSVFKIFTAAQAVELGLMNPDTMVNTRGPIKMGGFSINDFHNYGAELSLTNVIVKSSNLGTARVAQMIGAERQRDFLASLGLLEPTPVELIEAAGAKPLRPSEREWKELSTMTISYGHGVSTSPLHLAAAYSTIANGGTRVTPTLVRQESVVRGPRVISPEVSAISRNMLRQVVARGTASFGEVPGYSVGGKTGSADKPGMRGRPGYDGDKLISTFASIFPSDNPAYVLIVSLDEPEIYASGEMRRTAGWTAVPVAGEIIRRVAPLLGLKPALANQRQAGVTLARQ